eukprot:815372-Pyramimonas_sp.AAC.1
MVEFGLPRSFIGVPLITLRYLRVFSPLISSSLIDLSRSLHTPPRQQNQQGVYHDLWNVPARAVDGKHTIHVLPAAHDVSISTLRTSIRKWYYSMNCTGTTRTSPGRNHMCRSQIKWRRRSWALDPKNPKNVGEGGGAEAEVGEGGDEEMPDSSAAEQQQPANATDTTQVLLMQTSYPEFYVERKHIKTTMSACHCVVLTM